MKIHNLEPNSIQLNFSNLETIRFYKEKLAQTLKTKSHLEFHFEDCILSTSIAPSTLEDYAYCATQSNPSIQVFLSQSIMRLLSQHETNEMLDEVALSIASVHLNELIQACIPSSPLKITNCDTHQISHSSGLYIEFKLRLNLQMMSVLIKTTYDHLMSFLAQNAHSQSRNLDLMLDVPFVTRVEIGQISKSIKEILELTPGMILELDKSIHAPLDVVVNKNVIAKGELVEVSGNYGLEVTHICQSLDKSPL